MSANVNEATRPGSDKPVAYDNEPPSIISVDDFRTGDRRPSWFRRKFLGATWQEDWARAYVRKSLPDLEKKLGVQRTKRNLATATSLVTGASALAGFALAAGSLPKGAISATNGEPLPSFLPSLSVDSNAILVMGGFAQGGLAVVATVLATYSWLSVERSEYRDIVEEISRYRNPWRARPMATSYVTGVPLELALQGFDHVPFEVLSTKAIGRMASDESANLVPRWNAAAAKAQWFLPPARQYLASRDDTWVPPDLWQADTGLELSAADRNLDNLWHNCVGDGSRKALRETIIEGFRDAPLADNA